MLRRQLALCGLITLLGSHLAADPPAPVTPPAGNEKYRLDKVQRGDFLRLANVEGRLRPEQVSGLSARISGVVARVMVREGDPVRAGDILLQLDPRVQELDLELARVQLQRARAEFASGEVQMKLAEMNFDRLRRLEAMKSVSEQELIQARTQIEAARARLDEVKAGIAIAELQVRKAQIELEHTRMLAPFEGIVMELRTNVGEQVGPGSERLILLASSSDRLLFRAPVEVNEAKELQVGQVVQVGTIEAKIERILHLPLPGSDSPRPVIEVRLENRKRMFAPFQQLRGTISLGKLEGVLQVPRAALEWQPLPEEVDPSVREAYREYKYRQGSDRPALLTTQVKGVLRPVKVEVLATSSDTVAIKGPVKEGDVIVVGRAGLE